MPCTAFCRVPASIIWRVDELRRAIEGIAPDQYESAGYYGRWITAIETLLVERDILSREEIDRRVEETDEQAK